jgi:acetyl-CoA C-acetyltransferase
MKEVVVVSAARTPFGKFGGALKDCQAVELGGIAIEQVLKRAGIVGEQVDETIMGMALPAGAGQVPGRQAAVRGGIPHTVPALTINKVCGSALKAVSLAAALIKAGDADVVVAGGMESMSNAPYLSQAARWGARMGDAKLKDAILLDGLWCPDNDVHMAVLGSQVAAEFSVSRKDQDKWAYRSQMRWQIAERLGKFDEERVPVKIKSRRGEKTVAKDEFPRPDTTLEMLGQLKPVFDPAGNVTAGNAPGVNDGACAIVLMSREKAQKVGAPALGVVKGYSQVAQESKYIATVPGLAIKSLLDRHSLTLDHFDLLEINEAFAAVPLVSAKILAMGEKDLEEKVNVNGGAVAVGHPIGATGARILMTLLYELRRSGKKNGVAAICSGMAQGDAVWVAAE